MLQYKEILKTVLPDYMPLKAAAHDIQTEDNYLARSNQDVAELAKAGVLPHRVFADTRSMDEAQIQSALGKCRFVAGGMEDVRLINRVALEKGREQSLTAVGLYLVPEGHDSRHGIREADLPRLAPELKQLSAISVQGCFVEDCTEGLYGKDLGRYFRTCYESAKRMTVVLPCSMPYLCITGALEAVARNLRKQPETVSEVRRAAEIVAMQNRTAFYAKLLVT